MAKFKKGDMVQLVKASNRYAYSIGYEYEVLGYIEDHVHIYSPNDINPNPNHDGWCAPENYLRLIPPKEEVSTWKAVQELTNWNPTKEKVL